MSENNIRAIGESIKRAGNLNTEPLAIYGSKEIPEDAVAICSIDRCVAKTIFEAAFNEKIPAVYMGKDTHRCCPAAMTYFGYTKPAKFVKYFVSTGNEKIMNGAAEYLKASPEIVEGFLESLGEIKPLNDYMVIQRCKDVKEEC